MFFFKRMTEERKALKNTSVTIDMTEKMEVGVDDWKNVGYGILKELYFQLELDRFWRSKMRGKKIKYNLELIFRLLVISRILYPGSKKETYENRGKYFEKNKPYRRIGVMLPVVMGFTPILLPNLRFYHIFCSFANIAYMTFVPYASKSTVTL